jgi:ATP-dependent DNA helicase RecQ
VGQPSARNDRDPLPHAPELFTSIAQDLAVVGKLHYLGSLAIGRRAPPEVHRLLLDGRAQCVRGPDVDPGRDSGCTGPVLLVDDLAGSRWTLTVTARALRLARATSVLPFSLALRG